MVESDNDLTTDAENEAHDTSDPQNEAIIKDCSGDSVIVTDNQELENSVLLHKNMKENKENILSKGQSRKQREENKRRRESMEWSIRTGKVRRKMAKNYNRSHVKITRVDIIFIFWLKWLLLRQFAYADYKSEVPFFLSRQDF